MKKTLYAIGIGVDPGKHLSQEALALIEGAAVAFAPRVRGKSRAWEAVQEKWQGPTPMFLDYAMSRDQDPERTDLLHSEEIAEKIPEGGYGVFLTIGDALIYSTVERFQRNPQLDLRYVPGIPSYMAAFHRKGWPLVRQGECFLLMDVYEAKKASMAESLAILKIGDRAKEIGASLKDLGFHFYYCEKMGSPEERIWPLDRVPEKGCYMSLMIARKAL